MYKNNTSPEPTIYKSNDSDIEFIVKSENKEPYIINTIKSPATTK